MWLLLFLAVLVGVALLLLSPDTAEAGRNWGAPSFSRFGTAALPGLDRVGRGKIPIVDRGAVGTREEMVCNDCASSG
jgi:hypothetical protein